MMDPDRRRVLENRRAAIRAELELRERLAQVDDLVAELRRRGGSPQVVSESPTPGRWLESLFDVDGQERRIDRSRLSRFAEIGDVSEEAVAEWLAGFVAGTTHRAGKAAVHLLWSNARRPAIRLSLTDFLRFPGSLTDDFEAWAICPEERWVVEYIRDAGWMWGATRPPEIVGDVPHELRGGSSAG